MPISPRLVPALAAAGHDVIHLADHGLHRMSDAEVMRKAVAEERVVLTADADFGKILALLVASKPSVVVLTDQAARGFASTPDRLIEVLAATEAALLDGAVIKVDLHRFRVRKLPIGS